MRLYHGVTDGLRGGQDIRNRAFGFACRITSLCDTLSRTSNIGRLLAPQLLGCGTSVAAMLEEAKAAESTRDFISKTAIALKESREAHVRLRVLERCHVGPPTEVIALCNEANQVVSILTAIIRNTRLNVQQRGKLAR